MTTQNDAEKTPDATIVTPPPTIRRVSSKIIISRTMAVLLMACILYAAFQIRYEILRLKTETSALLQQQASINAQADSNLATLNSTQEELSRVNKTLSSALKEHWYQNNDWVILKARHYLELATINAHWGDNPTTTLALLQQANTLLANLHEPALFAIRQAIAKDSAQINAAPTVDITGILSQLDAIQDVAASLEPKNPFKTHKVDASTNSTKATSPTWRDRIQDTLDQLKKLVIVRHNDAALLPMLTPAYDVVMRETIRLNLQEAQWAVLQHNQTVYELALKQAMNNITNTFGADSSSAQALVKQLSTLQETKLITPKIIPEESLKLLNQLIESKQTLENKNERPTTGEPAL